MKEKSLIAQCTRSTLVSWLWEHDPYISWHTPKKGSFLRKLPKRKLVERAEWIMEQLNNKTSGWVEFNRSKD